MTIKVQVEILIHAVAADLRRATDWTATIH